MPACIVKYCKTDFRKKDPNCILHVFPKGIERIKIWLQQTGQFGEYLESAAQRILEAKVHDTYRLCSKHFTEDSYLVIGKRKTLKKNAVPTIFPQDVQPSVPSIEPPLKRKKVKEEPPTTYGDTQMSHMTICSPPGTESDVNSTNSNAHRYFLKPHIKSQESRWTSVDPSQWSANKKINTDKIKTYVKATQVVKSTRDVGVQCGIIMLPLPPQYRETPLKSVPAVEDVEIEQECNISMETASDDQSPSGETNINRNFLVFESCLDALIKLVPCQFKRNCTSPIKTIWKQIHGSLVSVHVSCDAGHSGKLWDSQPKKGDVALGNIMLACATLFSGSYFSKVENFFKISNMCILSQSTYYQYQNKFLFPAVDRHWQLEQKRLSEQFSGQAVCLSGDGQCDSPGHSAKYCTYNLMEATTKKIVAFSVKQLTPGTSRMDVESEAFVDALDQLSQNNLNVGILCTDRHASIRKIMREKYSDILHQFDIWHMAKSIGAKVMAASKKRNCHKLSDWVAPVENHVRWCASHSNTDKQQLKEMWRSIIYHCVNKHSWEGAQIYTKCEHAEIPPNVQRMQQWLLEGSKAHHELTKIVLKKSWMKDITHMSYFCPTEELDIFHNTALKYKPNRNHFCIDGMIARTQLAVLDHNANVGRMEAIFDTRSKPGLQTGINKYKSQYRNKKGDLVLKNIHDPKTLDFSFEIVATVLAAVQGIVKFDWISKTNMYPSNTAPVESLSLESVNEVKMSWTRK